MLNISIPKHEKLEKGKPCLPKFLQPMHGNQDGLKEILSQAT